MGEKISPGAVSWALVALSDKVSARQLNEMLDRPAPGGRPDVRVTGVRHPAPAWWGRVHRPRPKDPSRKGILAYRSVNVRRRMIGMVNAGQLDLAAANSQLAALHLPPVAGRRWVSFRLPACVRVRHDGQARTMRTATAAIAEEFAALRWSRLDGCPEGFGLSEPVPANDGTGWRYTTVHTTLKVTVEVLAYEPGELEQTALGLLREDLTLLRRLRVRRADIDVWVDDDIDALDDGEQDEADYEYPQ